MNMYSIRVCLVFVSFLGVCHGGCPAQFIFDFAQNSSVLRTMSMDGNYKFLTDGMNITALSLGSYISMKCNDGFVNVGGPLNITCTGTMWTTFPNCISATGAGSIITAPVSTNNGPSCTFDKNSTFNVTNGFPTNMSLSFPTNNTATGWVQYTCMPGYTLDRTIGSLFACNNGIWSNKPQCNSTGRCLYLPMYNFVTTTPGIQTVNQSNITQPADNNTVVFVGSYIVVMCQNGFVNTGGSLNITCFADNSWSPFPNCVLNTSSGSTATSGCPLVLLRNFISNTSTVQPSNQTMLMLLPPDTSNVLSGSYLVVTCMNGYVNTGGSLNITCSASGAWSSFPNCVLNTGSGSMTTTPMSTVTGRCPVLALQGFMSTHSGIQYTNQMQLNPIPSDPNYFPSGSYIVVTCMNGYVNTGGSLNITCSANGAWSSFPNCVMNTGSGSMTTTPMSTVTGRCPVLALQGFMSTYTGIQYTKQLQLNPIPSDPNYFPSGSYIVVTCMNGYVNNGGSLNITCSASGAWSAFPNCVMNTGSGSMTTTPISTVTSRCPVLALQGFMSTYTGIQYTNQMQLNPIPSDPNYFPSGSYIVVTCMNGYVNTGGSLNITCSASGAWSAFPVCSMQGGMTNPVTSATCNDIPVVANSFIMTATNIPYADNKYTRTVEFRCNSGYSHVNTSGNRTVSCLNGVWDRLPVCGVRASCAVIDLQAALINVDILSQSLNVNSDKRVISGGWINLQCHPPYARTPTSGSLNITCLSTGLWSQFPICS